MTILRAPFIMLLLAVSLAAARAASDVPLREINLEADEVQASPDGVILLTDHVVVTSGDVVLTANSASVNTNTGDIFADGAVRLLRQDETLAAEHLRYNYLTEEVRGGEFRTGKSPAFATGAGFYGNLTNNSFYGTNASITADDYARPLVKVRTSEVKIVPKNYVETRDAVLYAGKVPVFYFPYWSRGLGDHQNNFTFLPGYRSTFGPYLLGSYNWFLDDRMDGSVHADWRQKRGFGGGPDLALHLGQLGEARFKYYYAHDEQPGVDASTNAFPENRQRLYFSYAAEPLTNLTFKSQVAYWSDQNVTHDFFEGEYTKDIEPKTFFEANKLWQNWSLDAVAQPRVNGFFETVERLPDVRLSGFRQQLGNTPLFYESQSSVGWYKRMFADTNTIQAPYSAARADTFHQITLPETYFGWLTVTPRAGGRFTYYNTAEGAGATTTEHDRTVFNTGAEISTKASRVWPAVQNHLLDVDGLRHIFEPSINYVYVPSPSTPPSLVPQFDYELTNNLYLLPIDFPDYNSIDSIDSQNVIRWGMVNRLQTKRDNQIDNLVRSSLYLDWRLKPRGGQGTFSDVYSDLEFKPRSWLKFDSELRYDIDAGRFQLARHQMTLQPNNRWSWGLGHFYLRGGPQFGAGENLITSTFYYRLNENWGTRIAHNFNASSGTMQQQYYTLYRDLRSWTAALTFRIQEDLGKSKDYTVAVTFSFKAFPRYGLGQDTINPSTLVGR